MFVLIATQAGSWFQAICSRRRAASKIFILESAFCQQRPALMTRSSPHSLRPRHNFCFRPETINLFTVTGSTAFSCSSGVSFSRDRMIALRRMENLKYLLGKRRLSLLILLSRAFFLFSTAARPCSMENLFLTQFRFTSYFFITAQRWASHLPNVGSSIVRSLLLLWLEC